MTEKEKKKYYTEMALNTLKGICNTQENRILLVWEAEEILNLIQKQQEEIDKKEWHLERALSDIEEADRELKKKDKIIDEMAKAFKQDDIRTVEEIKQYFKKKVEDEYR